MRIGIDIGGVIVKKVSHDEDTSFFSDNFLNTPEVEGALSSIRVTLETFGIKNVFVVSACGPVVQKKSIEWLAHHNFFGQTRFLEENVYFCRARLDKAPICRALGISCFIDDRVDVLEEMSAVEYKILFGEHKSKKPGLINTHDWKSVLKLFEKLGRTK